MSNTVAVTGEPARRRGAPARSPPHQRTRAMPVHRHDPGLRHTIGGPAWPPPSPATASWWPAYMSTPAPRRSQPAEEAEEAFGRGGWSHSGDQLAAISAQALPRSVPWW